ncbi:hypothetical protein TNCV_2544421 [Trichonephila clavipes]|nr:hypothetical protein TNCV_2544421 [Trichonephila clavipes]
MIPESTIRDILSSVTRQPTEKGCSCIESHDTTREDGGHALVLEVESPLNTRKQFPEMVRGVDIPCRLRNSNRQRSGVALSNKKCGRGSLEVKVTDSWLERYEFEPELLKTRRVEALVHVTSVETQCPPVSVVWYLGEESAISDVVLVA